VMLDMAHPKMQQLLMWLINTGSSMARTDQELDYLQIIMDACTGDGYTLTVI
jgi:hypothetical protein